MFTDGLWISGMTLHIHRQGAPIPKDMQDDYIKVNLSAVQMNAIAALLGLGYRNGELLLYKDEDVENNILKQDGFNFRSEYEAINSAAKNNRRAIQVASPIIESSLLKDTQMTKDDAGKYLWSADDIPEEEDVDEDVDYDDEEYVDWEDADTYEGDIEYLEDGDEDD